MSDPTSPALNTARQRRYEALSTALTAGHPQHLAAAAGRYVTACSFPDDPPRHRQVT